jgi:peptidoglycan/xylan/chitin deacetylase (PgdA/CDA1 family)
MSARRPSPPLVLALHQTPSRPTWTPLALGRDALRRILGSLRERGVRFVPLASVGPEGPMAGEALLTVDDGYASTAEVLAPLAMELGIPWSVFVLVGAVGGSNDWDLRGVVAPERHLREDELRDLAAGGVGIGSHGMTHRDFTSLDDAALDRELAGSRDWLEARTGTRVEAVSYPWGRVDARVERAARRAGYRLGFGLRARRAGATGVLASPYALPRTALYAPDRLPGVFAATALRGGDAGLRLRDAVGRLGGWLVARTLAATGRAHA